MIGDLRSYIKSQIKLVDSDLKENPKAFYNNGIGDTILDKSYQIEINDITNILRTDYREDSVGILVSIFGRGYRDEVAEYDELLDKSLCIRDNIIKLGNFTGQFNIVNAEAGSIVASQLDGNDNAFKIDISLTLTIAYIRE